MKGKIAIVGDRRPSALIAIQLNEAYQRGRTDAEADVEDRMQRILDGEKELSYEMGRADAEDERANLLAFICKKYDIPLVDMNQTVDEWEELKGQGNE